MTTTTTNNNDATTKDAAPPPPPPPHVVIVGGGLAGLMAARQLLRDDDTVRVTLVEAQDRLGGRLQADTSLVPGYPLDMGAEFIHCVDTTLTRVISEYKLAPQVDWEAYFVTAHADGGPDDEPTRDGKYGMYYCDGQLLMYDHASLHPLSEALEDLIVRGADETVVDLNASIADAMQQYDLPPSLRRLAVAGYGNTAGSTDMHKLSWRVLTRFERYWEEHETDGDFRLPAQLGMTSVVRALQSDLEQYQPRFDLRVNWPVSTIDQDVFQEEGNEEESMAVSPVLVHAVNQQEGTLPADAVICTVPPPLLPQILPNLLTAEQRETLQYVGFETVTKVMLKFNTRPWPAHLQSVICADGGPLPEIWFRNDLVAVADEPQKEDKDGSSSSRQTFHIMVAYLASGLADDFLKTLQTKATEQQTNTKQVATDLCLAQLAKVLSLELQELQNMHMDTLVHAWNAETEPYTPGGYMYPKPGLVTLAPLAAPCRGGRVVLAGEATNTSACCTMQAAMDTGVRAAKQVQNLLKL